MYDHTFSKLANHQIKHQVKHKVGCQPGDYIWTLYSSSGACVGMFWLTCSLYHPRGGAWASANFKHGMYYLQLGPTWILCTYILHIRLPHI